jgi:hypothetical protein
MSRTGRRYKDVLFALDVAHQFNQSLGKLQLQKFVYLTDVLSPIWNVISIGDYQTYKHGPYDSSVQNAVDVLAFRGAVNVADSNLDKKENTRVSYVIAKIGIKIVEKLKLEPAFSIKHELYGILGQHIHRRGWGKLKDMVYSEATFLSAKSDGYGRSLELNSLLSNETFQALLEFNNLLGDRSAKLSKENLVSIFFQILDNYELLKVE